MAATSPTGLSLQDAGDRLAQRWGAGEAAPADEAVEETPPQPEPQEEVPVEAGGGTEPQEQTEEAAEPVEDETPETFGTLADLMEAGGVQADALTATVTVDGAEVEVPLSEALAGYRREADYTRKTQALADERRAFEAERAQVAERLTASVSEAQVYEGVINELFQTQQAELQQRYGGIDWNALRAENPAEFAAAYAQQQAETQALQQRHSAALAAVQAKRQQAQQAFASFQAETLAKEKARMLERIPAWNDPVVMEQEGGEVASYLMQTYSATPQEVASIVDHRLTDLARKAMLWDRLQAQAPKVKAAAKAGTLRPGRRQTPVPAQTRAVRDTREKLGKTHSMDAAAEALKARWGP